MIQVFPFLFLFKCAWHSITVISRETQVKHTVGPLRHHECTRVKSHNIAKICELLTKIIAGKSGEGEPVYKAGNGYKKHVLF